VVEIFCTPLHRPQRPLNLLLMGAGSLSQL